MHEPLSKFPAGCVYFFGGEAGCAGRSRHSVMSVFDGWGYRRNRDAGWTTTQVREGDGPRGSAARLPLSRTRTGACSRSDRRDFGGGARRSTSSPSASALCALLRRVGLSAAPSVARRGSGRAASSVRAEGAGVGVAELEVLVISAAEVLERWGCVGATASRSTTRDLRRPRKNSARRSRARTVAGLIDIRDTAGLRRNARPRAVRAPRPHWRCCSVG